MKITIKNALHALFVPLLLATPGICAMKRPRTMSTQEQFEQVMNEPFAVEQYEIHLTGTIELKPNVSLGFGTVECFKQLKQAHIIPESAHQSMPLAPINVYIPDPKKHPTDPDKFINWTENAPTVIKEDIIRLLNTQTMNGETKLLPSFGGYHMTKENGSSWWQWLNKCETMKSAAHKQIGSIRFPPVIPVHLLLSSGTLHFALAPWCTATLTFDQHQELDVLTKKFGEPLITMFTKIPPHLGERIDELNILYEHQDGDEASLQRIANLEGAIDKSLVQVHNSTTKELKANGIISKKNHIVNPITNWRSLANQAVLFEDNTHKPQNDPEKKLRELTIEHGLKGENVFNFVKRQQTARKKQHQTYSLKN